MWFDTKFYSKDAGQTDDWVSSPGTVMSDGQALIFLHRGIHCSGLVTSRTDWSSWRVAVWALCHRNPSLYSLHYSSSGGPFALSCCCCFWKASYCRACGERAPSVMQRKRPVTGSCCQVHKQNSLKTEKNDTFPKSFERGKDFVYTETGAVLSAGKTVFLMWKITLLSPLKALGLGACRHLMLGLFTSILGLGGWGGRSLLWSPNPPVTASGSTSEEWCWMKAFPSLVFSTSQNWRMLKHILSHGSTPSRAPCWV